MGLAMTTMWQLAGCGGSAPASEPGGTELKISVGQFDLDAGVPARTKARGELGTGGAALASGEIEIDISGISVTPRDPAEAKGVLKKVVELAGDEATKRRSDEGLGKSGRSERMPSASVGVPSAFQTRAKTPTSQQADSVLEITIWIAEAALYDTVCDDGTRYGPYRVTLDADYAPTAIDPPTISLTDATINVLNTGEFSLCIGMLSPITGTIEIESLTFHLAP